MCLAVPGKILSMGGDTPMTRKGKVSFGGAIADVNLAYVPQAQIGDYVVVHAGFALSKVDPNEALKLIAEIQDLQKLVEGEETAGGLK